MEICVYLQTEPCKRDMTTKKWKWPLLGDRNGIHTFCKGKCWPW